MSVCKLEVLSNLDLCNYLVCNNLVNDVVDPQCFLCAILRDVIFIEAFYECYVNDLYTTTCSGMLGHRSWYQSNCFDLRLET